MAGTLAAWPILLGKKGWPEVSSEAEDGPGRVLQKSEREMSWRILELFPLPLPL